MIDQRDGLQEYLERVTPHFRELFGIAHAITDQYDAAEYVVQRVIQRGYAGRRRNRKLNFREQMKLWTVRLAADYVKQNGRPSEGEGTWTGFDGVNTNGNLFLSEAVREPLLMRRILMMKFGAGLHSYEIAPIVGMDKARVRGYLQQFEARVDRRMRNERGSYEKLARRAALQELKRVDADVPDVSATFRQLQADLIDPVRPSTVNPLSRAVGVVFLGIGIALCVALFWLFAVLMENNGSAPFAPQQEILQETAAPETAATETGE